MHFKHAIRNASIALSLLLGLPALADDSLSAQQIIDQTLENDSMGFQAGEVVMTLVVQAENGSERTRRVHVRGMEEAEQNRALVRVLEPAAQAGQSYLFRENEGAEDDVFIFLPALDDAPRRISGSQKNGSFLGTHFTYADLESRDVRDASYERLPDEEVGGFPVYVIDATPSAGTESDYARVRMWIRQSDNIPLRTRYFNERNETLKTMFTEDVAQADGRTYIREATLRLEEGGFTTMRLDTVDFDATVSASEFTQQALVQ